jgi:hypothetical protein
MLCYATYVMLCYAIRAVIYAHPWIDDTVRAFRCRSLSRWRRQLDDIIVVPLKIALPVHRVVLAILPDLVNELQRTLRVF